MTVDLATLIDPAATLTQIGSGYQFTEGPGLGHPAELPAVPRHPG